MIISREVKVSDDNYGNTTQRLEFNIAVINAGKVSALLDRWEALIRQGVTTKVMDDSMTVREVREFEQRNGLMEDILGALALYEES